MAKENKQSTFDKINQEILRILLKDARTSQEKIAEKVGLSAGPVSERIQAMRNSGYIKGTKVVVDPERLGYRHEYIVLLQMEKHTKTQIDKFEADLKNCHPNILECLKLPGSWDYALKVIATTRQEFERILLKISAFDLIARTRSIPVMREVFSNQVPIRDPKEEA